MANAIISTAQPGFNEIGPLSLTSAAAYDNSLPTSTAPSTTGATGLILSPGQDYPSLLRVVPYAGANNYTSVSMRVVGWNAYAWRGTNLVPFSETFETSGAASGFTNWADTNLTRTSTNNTNPISGTNALRITASAANATLLNNLALSSAARAFSIYLRRVTGTGNIQATMDGGTTWTPQAITSSWARYTFTATSTAHVGIRIVTSGDAIEVWGAQVEVGSGSTAYTATGNSPASAIQSLYIPNVLADLTLAYNATSGSIPNSDSDGVRQHFFQNITAASGIPTVNLYVPGTAAAAGTPPAHAIIDTVGSQFVTLQFKATGTTPTMGAFYNFI